MQREVIMYMKQRNRWMEHKEGRGRETNIYWDENRYWEGMIGGSVEV